MRKQIIKPRRDLSLRKVGNRYMIVEAGQGQVNLTNVYSLNESAALLWQRMSETDCSAEELAAWLADCYRIEPERAQADVCRQVEEWEQFGLLQLVSES